MSDTPEQQVPEGFEQLPTGLGFSDNLQPCFRRIRGEDVSFGLFVAEQHCNLMGVCHGGVLSTMADIAAATGLNVARGVVAGSPTLSLSLDFIGPGRLGDWLQADVDQATLKRRFGFSHGTISGPKGLVARFNGTFYLPEHEGMWRDGEKAALFRDGKDPFGTQT